MEVFLMRKYSKYAATVAAAALAVLLVSQPAWAQQRQRRPRLSPKASVSNVIGFTEIAMSYSRPGVKWREIWGGLVPWDEVWRAGANEATTIEFGDDVKVNGEAIKAGKYSLWLIPAREGEWTWVFNTKPDVWGTQHDAAADTLKVPVTPRKVPVHVEWMMFSFRNLQPTSAEVVLSWEMLEIPFTIEVTLPEGGGG
jgi:hypothetical protein